MPSLTIGRMAKLYRMHRSSLYQAVAEGRVSAGVDGKGQRVIDLAEMIRVYGEPAGLPDTTRQPPGSPPDSSPDSTLALAQGDRLAALLEAVERLTGEVEALRQELAHQRLLLEHKPAERVQEDIVGDRPASDSRQHQPARSFADLLAGMD